MYFTIYICRYVRITTKKFFSVEGVVAWVYPRAPFPFCLRTYNPLANSWSRRNTLVIDNTSNSVCKLTVVVARSDGRQG